MQKKSAFTKLLRPFATSNMQFANLTSRHQGNHLNDRLVEYLIKHGTIRSPAVEKVMRSIDRGEFSRYDPYEDW